MRPLSWFRLLAVVLTGTVLAQVCVAQQYSFQSYGQPEGLANLVPLCLLEDRVGFLWVGTQNGLFRYDGSRFEAFGAAQGLPGSHVVSLYQDRKGVLYAATGGGLARLDQGRFVPVLADGAKLIVDRRQSVTADPSGRLLVATPEGLAVQMSPASEHFNMLPWGAKKEVFSVYTDPHGKVWAGCGDRLCVVEQGKMTAVAPELPHDSWTSLRMDNNGGLWLAGRNAIVVRPAGASRFEPLPPPLAKSGFIPFLGDPALEVERNGDIILTTPNGLCRWAHHKWQLIDARSGLARDDVTTILADREGSLWVGFAGLGLQRWLGYGEWETWSAAEGLPHESVWAIHRDKSGRLWVGTNGGLGFSSTRGDAPQRFAVRPELKSKLVLSIGHSGDGALWIGTGNDGLWRLDEHSGRIARVLPAVTAPKLLVDSGDYIWVAGAGAIYRSVTPAGTEFVRQAVPGIAGDEVFHSLAEDARGRIWMRRVGRTALPRSRPLDPTDQAGRPARQSRGHAGGGEGRQSLGGLPGTARAHSSHVGRPADANDALDHRRWAALRRDRVPGRGRAGIALERNRQRRGRAHREGLAALQPAGRSGVGTTATAAPFWRTPTAACGSAPAAGSRIFVRSGSGPRKLRW